MVLWQSPDTVLMCAPAVRLSRLHALFHVGAWCLDPSTHVLSFSFVSGFGHSRFMFCLVLWACSLKFARPRACSSVHVCFLLLHTVLVFIGCVHSCYVLCCVARSLCFSWVACFHVVMSCVNTWLMSILISCKFVPCFAHGWCFGSLVFVLFEHMAFVLVFCVLCALMSIVLTPPILFTDYWLICPTCLPRYPPHLPPS